MSAEKKMPNDEASERARATSWRTALSMTGGDRQAASVISKTAELDVIRRLVSATLPGGEAEFWQLVDKELRS
ncbi:MAG TPA: hypothetical protein VFZ21_26010 [Gemmatimonadaceae bacterium]|nr:hypothetical protein [Gemmatimonadaceae bacterium]